MSATIVDDRKLTIISVDLAVKQYLAHCRDVSTLARHTIAERGMILDNLIEACGPGAPVHEINSQHMGFALKAARRPETPRETALRRVANPQAKPRSGRAEGTLNLDRGVLRSFIEWAKNNRYYSHYDNPTSGFRDVAPRALRSQRDETRYYVPVDKRNALLEAAGSRHQRDRFVVAMGLYGGRRWDDMASMTIGDIDLDNETFKFTNGKAGGVRVTLPYSIWPEFGREIRSWLAFLAGQFGQLNPEWHLICHRLGSEQYSSKQGQASMHRGWPVDPTRRASYEIVKKDVKLALEMIGAPTEGIASGVHSLRHGCSRWLRDSEEWSEEDIADWLDHASTTTTRSIYLSGGDTVKRLANKYGEAPPTVKAKSRRHLSAVPDSAA